MGLIKQKSTPTGKIATVESRTIDAIVEDVKDLNEQVSDSFSKLSLQYKEIELSSLTILSDLSLGAVLMDAPAPNQYYDFYKLILEYNFGTTPYIITDYIIVGNYFLSTNFLASPTSTAVIIQNPWQSLIWDGAENANVDYGGGIPSLLGLGLNIGTYNATNPTGGDGTILVKVWYKIRTIGSEL